MRILVADDSASTRAFLVETLEKMGHEVITAKDGLEAFVSHRKDHVPVIIVDWSMPVMDGLKLIHLMRGEDALQDIPICVITTEGASGDRERALALGANEYLTKPIQANKVLSVVKDLLKMG